MNDIKTVYVVQQEEAGTGQWFDGPEADTFNEAERQFFENRDRWKWRKLRIIKRSEEVVG